MKTAVIIGITGQDSSYLAELLLSKGYSVIGVSRRKSINGNIRINHLLDNKNFKLVAGDVTDQGFLNNLVIKYKPHELFNMSAQSFVLESWNTPVSTLEINAGGTLKCLEAIRNFSPNTKFLQASSSEQFGKLIDPKQNENSYMFPKSPYGISKLAAYWYTVNYRESYKLFACNSICFNHSSPRRGQEFVTKKIVENVARIKKELQEKKEVNPLILGNLESKRDFGYAKDYVEAMYLTLQQDEPQDFVIASGETHSIREFVEEAFKFINKKIIWEGKGIDEVGKVDKITVVRVSKDFFRPAEVDLLLGDSSKAKRVLGWQPKTRFKELARLMIDAEINGEKK